MTKTKVKTTNTAKKTPKAKDSEPRSLARIHLDLRVKRDGSISKMKNPAQKGKGHIGFAKGNSGRPKGSKNKFTTLKNAFVEAFNSIGGAEELAAWANRRKAGHKVNQKDFYNLLSKMLPKEIEVSGPGGGPISNLNISGEKLTDEQLESIITRSD